MTRTLGDITSELREKVLGPAREEAEKMVEMARSQAEGIIEEAKAEATRIRENARQEAEKTLRQLDTDMEMAARDFILLVQERLEKAVVRPVVEEEVRPILEDKEFLSSVIDALIKEFARFQGRENKIEILLPERQKELLEKWFLDKFIRKASSGLVVHFSDKIAFGFKLGVGETGAQFNFGDGIVEVFSEFCAPRFRKYFLVRKETS